MELCEINHIIKGIQLVLIVCDSDESGILFASVAKKDFHNPSLVGGIQIASWLISQ